MTRMRILIPLTLGLAGSAAHAAPAAQIDCVHAKMGMESREIAFVMMMNVVEAGADSPEAADQKAEVEYLINEAHEACLDLYPWSSGSSESAQFYAFVRIMNDTAREMIETEGYRAATIEAHYNANKKGLAKLKRLEESHIGVLLNTPEWKEANDKSRFAAAVYLETLWQMDRLLEIFTYY